MTVFVLALGGGGARGFAHVGVLRVLAREGIRPDIIAGTSMGGLVGAFLAAGHDPRAIELAAANVSLRTLVDLRPGRGLLRVSSFEAFLASYLPPTFEELPTPLIVTATDVLSGRLVYLHRGPLYPALRATSAYPGAVDPVAHEGMLLADGGILNQVPADAALFLGARRVIAVDVTAPAPLELNARRRFQFLRWNAGLSPVRSLSRALEIMQAQLTDARLSLYRPEVIIRPQLEGVDLTSFRRVAEAARAGELAASARSAELRALLGAPESLPDMLPREQGDA